MDRATAIVICVSIICFTAAATILLVTAIKTAYKINENKNKAKDLEQTRDSINNNLQK